MYDALNLYVLIKTMAEQIVETFLRCKVTVKLHLSDVLTVVTRRRHLLYRLWMVKP